MFDYDRSADGAKEKITIKGCNIEIAVNGEAKTVTELNFILNEYGDCTGDKATQYQCKIPVGKKLSAGDTVEVIFKQKTGTVTGEGESTAKIDTLTVSLIDNAESAGAAGWYNEIAKDQEYQPLFDKENSSNNGNPVTPPAGDEGNTGTGNEDGKVAYGLTLLDGWDFYEIGEKSDTSARISYSEKTPTQYNTCCGADITTGTATKASFKVRNNDSASAYVKLDIKNESKSAVTAAKVNGSDADIQYGGADTTIEANGEATFEFTLDPSKNAIKFVVGLNNNQETNPNSGDITIYEAYMYK